MILSGLALVINLKGIPLSAKMIREAGVKAALYKIETPVEPGAFNTDIPNYVIFVKNGDVDKGLWENVFIESKDGGNLRLITAKSGKIDSSGEKTELVLSDASVTTLAREQTAKDNLTLERVANLRVNFDSVAVERKKLLDNIRLSERKPEELGLTELLEYARKKEGREKIDAFILWHRQITLSLAPLVLAFLGVNLVLRFGQSSRSGRGWGSLLALGIMIAYYLLALFGEQLARSGQVPVFVGCWLSTFIALAFGFWWYTQLTRVSSQFNLPGWNTYFLPKNIKLIEFGEFEGNGISWLLERDLISALLRYFILLVVFFVSLYFVFTGFELWKYVVGLPNGWSLLGSYLLFLFPLAFWQIAPIGWMLAILIVLTIKSRSNEIVAWTSAGQSAYRLVWTCLILSLLVGALLWEMQENLLPVTNPIQDNLRARIRGQGVVGKQEGRTWISTEKRLYSFVKSTADPTSKDKSYNDVNIYEYNDRGSHLIKAVFAKKGEWKNGRLQLSDGIKSIEWENSKVDKSELKNFSIMDGDEINTFQQAGRRTMFLSSVETANQIKTADTESEARELRVALQKKYSVWVIPIVFAMFCVPLSLSTQRQKNSLPVVITITIWLIFMGVTGFLEQFGESGLLPAYIAVWSPICAFMGLGGILLARIRT
jgi:lipopolysaccharide export system permease protein